LPHAAPTPDRQPQPLDEKEDEFTREGAPPPSAVA